MNSSAWLVGGRRTPFGRFGGGLRDVTVVDLGSQLALGTLETMGWDVELVDELLLGMGMIEGGHMVPARLIAEAAGFRLDLPTLTMDRACCSGMSVIGQARRAVATGSRSVLCIGMDILSRTPRLMHESRWGQRRGDLVVEDLLLLRSPLAGKAIAAYVGEIAVEYGVDRQQQDAWALQSHRRYFAAAARGVFDDEILPVSTPDGVLSTDEQPRGDTSLVKLAALKPVYGSPTVTAGNAPGLNDGGCAVVVADETSAWARSEPPLARLHGYVQTAGDATSSAYLPGDAIRMLVDSAGIGVEDLDVIEINEAFAATPLVSMRKLAAGDAALETRLHSITNINGGSVALGHPLGASGARVVLTAALELRRRRGRWAAAAVCGGFGQTDALLLERATA
jgi:acetyl-CoA C-acetyltransferase